MLKIKNNNYQLSSLLMKIQSFLPLLFFLIAGCIHEYPDEADYSLEEATPLSVAIQLLLAPAFDTLRYSSKSANDNKEEGQRRFIIGVYEKGKRISHQSILSTTAPLPGIPYALPVYLRLQASVYTIAVWSDYVDETTHENTYYATEDMQNISLQVPYAGNTAKKECQCGHATIDLRGYQNQADTQMQVEIDLMRPQAKYEFIATDVQRFLQEVAPQYDEKETFSVSFTHEFFIPSAFDLLKGQIRDSWENATYTVPLNINEMSGEEHCIGFDYLFAVQTESIASVSITLQDSQGNTIAHTPNIRMPYKQGHITTVKGDFLTPIKAGIYIDKEYEGEINVNLDEIIHH